jgi:hypothetical protein
LEDIAVDEGNAYYRSSGGVLFSNDQTTLIQCPGAKSGSYAIRDGVARVEDSAFTGCARLTEGVAKAKA